VHRALEEPLRTAMIFKEFTITWFFAVRYLPTMCGASRSFSVQTYSSKSVST
jgi:hypothetical protein